MTVPYLELGTSDSAMMGACGRAHGEVELPTYRKFANSRLRALAAAVHAEMIAGFPSARPFLDSVEQAIAALVNGHAMTGRLAQMYKAD